MAVKEKKITRDAEPAELPEGWRVVRFDEIAQLVNDRVDNPSEAGVERYVGLEHLDPESLKIRRWGSPDDVEAQKLRFQPGDIIFGKRRAYQRKLAVADFEGICSAHAMVLRAREDTVVKDFLPFLMQSDAFFERALSISVGSLSPTINWKTLAGEQFTIPPKNEQRRIAEILYSANVTENNYQLVLDNLNKLREVASFRFFEHFNTDTQTNTCAELCDQVTVGIVVTPAKYYVPTGIPALRSLNVFPDRFSLEELVHISEEAHIQHSKSKLNKGDVVIVRTGRPGDAAVIPAELDNSNCIDLIIARPGPSLRPEFLSRFLNSSAGRRQLNRGTAGTAQQHFNVGALKKVHLPVVPVDEQDRIVAELNVIDAAINSVSRQVETIKQLRKALTTQLLTLEQQ